MWMTMRRTALMVRTGWTGCVNRWGGTRRGWPGRLRADTGMATSEYAVATIAACALAAVLYKVVTSGSVSAALESVIGKALHAQI
ncbi:DUF4244 domain-containing protein [Streptomyces sp. SID4917]|nr:DUF4244 domain-containing protein [Streptomyces sp. SID4917]